MKKLAELERPQTSPAQYTCGMLKQDGFSEVEFLNFPSDGKNRLPTLGLELDR